MLFNFRSHGITRTKADKEINVAQEIEEFARPIMQLACSTVGDQLGRAYFKGTFNTFIFSKESVLKYFYGEESNIPPCKDDRSADVLVVIIGAHDIDESGDAGDKFKAGERTAIICGMKEDTRADKHGKLNLPEGTVVLKVVDPNFVLGKTASSTDPYVADQYPPRQTLAKLPRFSGDDFKIFVVL